MNKFDTEVNNILVKKIERAKKKIKNDIKKGNSKIKAPNTPGNVPVSHCSPALRKGINQDIADTPMPLSVGV